MLSFQFRVLTFMLFLWGTLCNPTKSDVNLSTEKITNIREIGENVKGFINSDVEPCVDYYSHICDKYNNSAPPRPIYTEFNMEDIFIDTLKSKEMNTVEVKLMDYLTSCRERDEEDLGTFVKNFNFSESIGGWPVFDVDWNEDKFNLMSAIAEMKSYLIPVIIDPKFIEADFSFDRYFTIKILNSSILDDDDDKEKLTEQLTELGISEPKEIVNQCVNFENKYNEIISSSETESSTDSSSFKSYYKSLKEKYPEIDWDKHIATAFGQTLNDEFPIRIDNIEEVKKVVISVSKMNPKLVANYFFCRFVNKVFNEIKKLSNEEDCFHKTLFFFHRALSQRLLSNLRPNDNKYKEQFLEMMNSITTALSESMNMIEDDSGEESKAVKHILNNFISDLTEESVQKEFENVEIEYNKFLQNEFSLIRHKTRNLVPYYFDAKIGKWKYVHYMLPFAFVTYLHESQKQPSPITYDIISEDIIVQTIGLLKNSDDFSASMRDCYQRQLKPEEIEDRNLFGGLLTKILFEAYVNWANKNEDILQAENKVLKEYGLTSKQLLFVNFMRKACSEKKYLIQSYLRNSKEFSDVYNCPTGSPMNPEEKCESS